MLFNIESSTPESGFFVMLFGLNINHSPGRLLVICITRFVFYARINYQFKTSELKNVEKPQ